MTHKHPELDIVHLAHKHLNRHPKDKSFRYLSSMRRTFGPLATTQALKQAIRDYSMILPELGEILQAHEEGFSVKYGNVNLDRIMVAEPHYQEPKVVRQSDHWKQYNRAKNSPMLANRRRAFTPY